MKYDIVSIGHITNDVRDMMGERSPFVGGAAYFSPVAAARSGAKVLVVTKMAEADRGSVSLLGREGVELRFLPSRATTSIENIFHSPDPDARTLKMVSRADPFTMEEIRALPEAGVYHIAALFKDEVPDEAIRELAARGKVALDLQAVLRYFEGGDVAFRDWPAKEEYLPFVSYLKADSVEIKAIAGTEDREKAARMLAAWGAAGGKGPGAGMEILITRQDEVLAYDGRDFFRAPFDPVRLDGRAGRGDTCFLSYIARRARSGVAEATRYAAALTSMKMEKPGPFSGTVAQVEERMRRQGR